MARVTQFRLRSRQQKLFALRLVRRVAGNATHIVLCVDRVDGVHVLRAAGVATHAAGVDFLSRGVLEREYFSFVSAAVDVRLPWTVTPFAALPLRTLLGIQRGYKVRRRLKVIEKILRRHVRVTRFAGLRPDVQRQIARALVFLSLLGRLRLIFFGIGARSRGVNNHAGAAGNQKNQRQEWSPAAHRSQGLNALTRSCTLTISNPQRVRLNIKTPLNGWANIVEQHLLGNCLFPNTFCFASTPRRFFASYRRRHHCNVKAQLSNRESEVSALSPQHSSPPARPSSLPSLFERIVQRAFRT